MKILVDKMPKEIEKCPYVRTYTDYHENDDGNEIIDGVDYRCGWQNGHRKFIDLKKCRGIEKCPYFTDGLSFKRFAFFYNKIKK